MSESEKSLSLLVATTNKKKLEELEALLQDLPVKLVSLKTLPSYKEVPEDGQTFDENASLKALGYAKQTGMLTLGEDSGLCCEALEGAPGVYSARFAGLDKSDEANNEKLMRLLEKVPDNCRGAYYQSSVAIAEPDKLHGVVSGKVHGAIAKEAKGNGGFGYDPLFFYPNFGKTFGEVSAEMKHRVSHRGKALLKAKGLLKQILACKR